MAWTDPGQDAIRLAGGRRLYFGYGSNLFWPQMSARCPDAAFLCRAVLPDHVLAFTRDSPARGCGVADAVWRRFARLHGVLYAVSDADIATLDRLEGHLPGVDAYRRVTRRVTLIEGPSEMAAEIIAETYVVANKVPHVPPTAEYLQLIIEGARAWQLPADHIAAIEAVRSVEQILSAR